MSTIVLLVLSATVLWTYVLDTLFRQLRVPSVIPLVLTGLAVNVLSRRLGIGMEWVDGALPLMGTIGLVLIVLEGAMDLQLSRSRARLITVSLLAAVGGFAACAGLLFVLARQVFGLSDYVAAILAIPFAVISSAVAIPSARTLPDKPREFITYESSLSDILGVLVFYAWVNGEGNGSRFTHDLGVGGLISLGVSVLLSFGLFMVVNHLKGHVRFVPILAALFLIYAAGKWLHLSPLLLVLTFGVLLNNGAALRRWPRMDRWMSDDFEISAVEFKKIVAELEFAVRGVFFVLLGLWTPIPALADWRAWAVAGAMSAIIFGLRYVTLRLLGIGSAARLMWLAPRGLITVLLILSVTDVVSFAPFPVGAVTLTVLLTCSAVLAARPPVAPPGAAAATN